MNRDYDRTITIPVRLALVVLTWAAALGLLTWYTLGGPSLAGAWAILAALAAGTQTVLYTLTKHHRLIRQAFELGVETGKRENVTAMR